MRLPFRPDRTPVRSLRTSLQLESLGERAIPATLTAGDIVGGAVVAGGGTATVTFDGHAGDLIELISTSTPTQAGFTARAEVYSPSNSHIAGFWPGVNTVLTLTETGVYTIQVRDNDQLQSGTFTMGLEGRHPISANPGLLAPGGIVAGSIGVPTEKDQWIFSGAPGDRVELITTSTATTPNFTARVEVFAPSGTHVAGFWPGVNTVLTLAEAGDYMLQVFDANLTQSGGYTIGLEGLNPISPDTTPLVPGGIARGAISSAVEKDEWTFQGTAGDLIELISTSTSTTAAFTARIEVYGPSGTLVAGFWPGVNTPLTLTETGTYMVQVHDNDYAQTGEYTIGLEGLNPISPSPIPLVKGGITSGTIAEPTDKVQMMFQGTAGDVVELISTSRAVTQGFTARVEVYAPSGTLVAGFWPGVNTPLTLEETGTYMVQIHDANYARTGTFTIGLESINPTSPGARNLTNNVFRSGVINNATQKDQWVFNVPAGKRLRVVLTSQAINAGFRAFATVFTPSGDRVAGVFSGNNTFTVDTPGRYVIQISDAGFLKRGRYTLKARFV